ncbi:MAG TPA: alkaline phosphatase D family protein [Mycobacteriales bacterium]|nr:alkaline phosphatase D family protein [Mycobacteriales bacterium]
MSPVSRRGFLRGAAGLGVVLATTPSFAASSDEPRPNVSKVDDARQLFTHSVASGDPTATGAVLWTRLDPARLTGAALHLEVARDPQMRDVVLRRVVRPQDIRADRDGTVRVDTDGLLPSNSFLFFRFVYEGVASRTGRCRTAPAPGQPVDRLRLGVFTCQNRPAGFYGAYRHALTDDLDYLVHVGDFIYESNTVGNANGRDSALPSGASRMSSYADVVAVHATYRSDPDLQRAMELHTIIPTWDDHETVNNPWYDYEADAPASSSHPRGDEPEFMRKYFVEAAAGYHDWMPVRVFLDRDSTAPHEAWRLYRDVRLGDLAHLFMLDGRWYREKQPTTGTENVEALSTRSQTSTMLGREQAAWLIDRLRLSDATWRVLGNQTLFQEWGVMLPGSSRVFVNMDAWDGYRDERDAITAELAKRPHGNLVLTGDMHAFVWGYVQTKYGAESLLGDRVAVEIMTTGVSSSGLGVTVPGSEEAVEAAMLAANPHMSLFNWSRHGYTVVELRPDAAEVTAFIVPRDRADAPRSVYQRARIPADRTQVEVLERNSPSGLPATTPASPTGTTPGLPPGARQVTARSADELEALLLGRA